jgi:endonuclease III
MGRVRVTRNAVKSITTKLAAQKKELVSKPEDEPHPEQPEVEDQVEEDATVSKGKKGKRVLGVSPYPSYLRPTPEECVEVARLLSSVHGEVNPPKAIPKPSLTVTGCGEVPSVLDALLRTRLSAATTRHNSALAFKGLVKTFGTLQEGIGKGSVDWNKVRLADVNKIFKAIKAGGLAAVKSKTIKETLEMVYEENQERRREILASSKAADSSTGVPDEQNLEVVKAEQNVLSLDHLHLISDQDAFDALQKYPGIGVKTASCVLLFCLRRPSFAVDTHVHRMCNWLGWLPPAGPKADLIPGTKGDFKGANEEAAFFHLDTRIPDEYKYALHQLLIKHGMECPRCRAITGESSEGWNKGCVLEPLLKRTGARKEAKVKIEVDQNGKVIRQSTLTWTGKE